MCQATTQNSGHAALDIRASFALAKITEWIFGQPSDACCDAVADAQALGYSDRHGGRSEAPFLLRDEPPLLSAWESGWAFADECTRLPVWTSGWQTSDDGHHETQPFVVRSEEGFHPGLNVSHMGGDPGWPVGGAPEPTLEDAIRVAKGLSYRWHCGE